MAKFASGRNRANVLVGAPDGKLGGGCMLGPVATNPDLFPVDAIQPLDKGLDMFPSGYVSTDGFTKSTERSTEKIKDWNGDVVIITQSDHGVTLKTTFMEAANARLLKMIVGERNVIIRDGGAGITVINNADDLPHGALALEMKSGDGRKSRVFAPDIQVTSVGDVQFVKSGVIKYEVTMECFADVNDNKLYEFIDGLDAASGGYVRKLSLKSGATGGKFTVTVDGVSVVAEHNVTGANLLKKLQDAGAAETLEITGDGPYTFTNVMSVTVDDAALVGGRGESKVESTTTGEA